MEIKYKIVSTGSSPDGWPAGQNIYYKCNNCGDIFSSVHNDSISCKCRNMSLDVDYGRFGGKDESKISVLMQTENR